MKKVLLIFGSNGALGSGAVKTFVKKDYHKIYLFDFKHDKIKPDNKISLITVKDLSIEKNVKEAFSNIEKSKDTAFFLYTTIGGFAGGNKLWETDEDEWDKMFNMNLKTSFFIAKYFSRLIKESNSGSICFTAALTGLKPETEKTAYGASKAALIHMVETLAMEGKDINLSVNAIAPFIIDTPANRSWMKKANYEEWMKPEEIGELVQNIFMNYNFITGNIIKLTHRFSLN
jgi:NAD(P)-dependent dehydrogenase (short-subunit alcohol dehydrogenase family)